MKAVVHIALASSVLALLAGCAGTHEMTKAPAPQQTLTAEQQYIAYVERIAKRRGIHLTWVNPPKLADKAAAQQ
mgnify:CR=1 FL=1